MRRAALAFAGLFAAVAALPCAGQAIYKWTDATGKVQYSDQPPKNFKGAVTRMEREPAQATVPLDMVKPVVPALADGVKPPDPARERRERREKLQARLDVARAKVEAARIALDAGRESTEEDRRVIQQRVPQQQGNSGAPQMAVNPDPTQGQVLGGGMHGMTPRGNCRVARDANGNAATLCAASLLSQDYFDRVERLEAALAQAEEELAAAEKAYRLGVD